MKELYYQPEISEFHVGFEYEVQQMDEYGYCINEYCEFEYEFGEKLNLNRVRAKYLDKDDIESLGFRHKVTIENGNSFYKGEYDISLYTIKDNKYNMYISDNSGRLFRGTIKNKSELIKLLTQLNII